MSASLYRQRHLWFAVLLVLPIWKPVQADECRLITREWTAMDDREVAITRNDGSVVRITAKVADDPRERSAGFQHVCPSTIEKMPMLFLFPRPAKVSFHMANVHAPLDIAFVAADGRIAEIQRMATYARSGEPRQRTYYSPSAPIIAALEAKAGFFGALDVLAGKARIDHLLY